MEFGLIEDEGTLRFEQLQTLDAAYAAGNHYPECPRCEGSRTVEAITKLNGDYIQPTIESFSCPLCGGTGEADAERAEEWLLEILDDYEPEDDQEKYLDERKQIA